MPGIQSSPERMQVGEVRLAGGALLPAVEVAYEQYGHLSPAGDNAVLLCHALTGSAHAAGDQGWWDPLVGPGAAFDTDRYAVFCSNFLGSCYGTTGPLSLDPVTSRSYGRTFPEITVGDMVAVQRRLLEKLGVRSLVTVAGGSLGGMQVLEWAAAAPELVRSIIPVAANMAHAAWTIAFNECARQAIRNDPAFHDGDYAEHGTTPAAGLALARMIAMVSYRSAPSFGERFGRQVTEGALPGASSFEVSSYLRYQGDKLVERFDANSYLRITEAMDAYDVGDNRGGAHTALATFRGPALALGIDSDILYPSWQQRDIVDVLRTNGNHACYGEVHSLHGHDAFLMEWDQLDAHIRGFMGRLD
jgi:homoserine O-acetyltransferase